MQSNPISYKLGLKQLSHAELDDLEISLDFVAVV